MAAVSQPMREAPGLPTETPLPSAAPAPESPNLPETTDRNPVVLDVRDLKTYFFTYDGVVLALDGVSFKVRRGETVGLVGETGCGKSVTAFSVTRLIPDPPGRVISGKVLFRGIDLLWGLDSEARIKIDPKTGRAKVRRSFRRIKAGLERMSAVRGRGISMIFQEPTQAMNPVFSVSDQISEALLLHQGTRIVDDIMAATTDAPEVRPALEALVEITRTAAGPDASRAAAAKAGEAAHLASFGTQAFYLVRDSELSTEDMVRRLEKGLRRVHLSRIERSYLRYRRRRMVVEDDFHDLYLSEMREGRIDRRQRRILRSRRGGLRLRGFYYGIWGIRGRVQRPLRDEAFWRTVGRLEEVSIANPVQVARGYPHELSGGMLQRVMITMALAVEPTILIADEPTTALDVTIQAQILELMRQLKTRIGTAILLITHDLAVIAEVADRVCVMYAGQIVETARARDLYQHPLHPYTQGLLASIPNLERPDKKLSSIPGSVPDLIRPPEGCRFHPRCPYAMPVCKEVRPPVTTEGAEHTVACHLYKGPVAVE
ncbi:MAG: ABC transporter ATP-binding protein [Thermoplasmata archaeon]